MFSEIRDGTGRSLLVVLLIKPTIDLGYMFSVTLAGVRIAPTVIFGGLIFFYYARYRLNSGPRMPPMSRIIEALILLNIVSVAIAVTQGDRVTPFMVINYLLRILDSYLIYLTAFLAALRYGYGDIGPFVKAIVIGSAVAVFANAAAISFGFGGWAKGAFSDLGSLRQSGLYYDPGVLSNVAFFNLVFGVFSLHSGKGSRTIWRAFVIVLVFLDLYLIASAKSRAVMIEMAIFGFIYLLLFQRAWGKIVAPIAAIAIVSTALVVFDISMEELFVRFESDVAAIQGESGEGVTVEGDEVSLGRYESVGGNRLAIWAEALTEFLQGSPLAIVFGNFRTSVSHSDYIDIAVRNGVVGLMLYLLLLTTLASRSWMAARRARPGPDRTLYFMAFTLLICYMFYSLPFRPLYYTTSAWYMWLVVGLAMARECRAAAEGRAARRASKPAATEGEPAVGEEIDDPDDPGAARPLGAFRSRQRSRPG
jgi:O-antigen ligase